MEKKSFGVALLVWFFLGGFGGHRIYIKEKVSILLWYFIANICTLGILALVDLFLIKGMIEAEYTKNYVNNDLENKKLAEYVSEYQKNKEFNKEDKNVTGFLK